MGLTGIQPCILCTSKRRFISAEAVTKNYEIQILECPECESQVRLVQRIVSKVRHV